MRPSLHRFSPAVLLLCAGCGSSSSTPPGDGTELCGNSQLDIGELCEVENTEAPCPELVTDCDDADTCTEDSIVGEHCGRVCVNAPIADCCPAGGERCDGLCTDVQSDLENCGGCGVACAAGEVCSDGECAVSCQAELTECDGVCRDVQRDPTNCGACGVACAAGELCSDAECGVSCQDGLTACDGICRDVLNDRTNCGACGVACGDGQVCADGACALSCQDGLTNCDGTCRDVTNDRANCGACGVACGDGEVCVDSGCALACPPGLTECDGSCRDLFVDADNCGSCSLNCRAGEVCSEGLCQVNCQDGQTQCDGVCRDLQSDNTHCGSCGRACADGEVCSAGVCDLTCPVGQVECNGSCVDLDIDPTNCGGCDVRCGPYANASPVCDDQVCGLVCRGEFEDCDDEPVTGCETDTSSAHAHCGGCNLPCAFDEACVAGTCVLDVVDITEGNVAYGHHGACSGWNLCGDAATCAQWACEVEGFSEAVSFGRQAACNSGEFAMCHLLFNGPDGGVQYDWGTWCAVMGVGDILCR